MSRYIDADKMLEICTNYISSVFPKEYKFAKQDAELLTTMAWFEDKAIDIVRCSECKRVDTMECPIYEVGLTCRDDDYCSKGIRAEQTERSE